MPFATAADYRNWIARLRAVGTLVDQQHRGRLVFERRARRPDPAARHHGAHQPQLALQAAERPEDSPFYAPFRRLPESIPAGERSELDAAGRSAIAEIVLPAYRRLQAEFIDRYLPRTRASIGIFDTPDGAAFYRERIAHHTTRGDLTAAQLHATGLAEVARIRGEMLGVMQQVGFQGDLAGFFALLRSDPRFYYRTPQELFDGYVLIAKRIDPNLVRLFGVLPRTPYGVREIPATSAPNTTTAYYQPSADDGTRAGYYYVNLYRPEVRPKWEMEVLTAHEAVPGHHLQIALGQERRDLPAFRRNAAYTAFVEGWALYSESLGAELGLYQDPYSHFGQLTYDMWRAVRLVVDTGIHAQGWSRQQAIDYFKDNAPKTEADIVNEIDRYIAWPGQALAYKVGQLDIRALRSEAERALGRDFDVRAFHDTVLEAGAVPLDVLDARVRAWIAARQRAAAQRHAAA
ncbi:MAG: DUF885 domain-containing protein, partial [Steroidobacteraceae bacterium]